MISAIFGQFLRSGRDHFNARFAAARHADPKLDQDAFAAFLAEVVDPVVQAVDAVRPERTADFVTQAYDVALELASLRLVGPSAKHTITEAAWRRLLPPAAALVSLAPRRALASVSNAAHQLATTTGARPEQWLAILEASAPACADLDTWLKIGQVAAWRSGLAHYRASALAQCETLPPALALRAVGAPPDASWSAVREWLAASPWTDPTQDRPGKMELQVVSRAGGFRGFGGPFGEPPHIVSADGNFMVVSGPECWVLTADAFGATFHRATPQEKAWLRAPSRAVEGLVVSGTRLVAGVHALELGELGRITSLAANASTIAVTGQLTYFVVLIQRPPSV